jgi:hypothetical protein
MEHAQIGALTDRQSGLDFDAFVRFLTAHGHNFTLLWRVEQRNSAICR